MTELERLLAAALKRLENAARRIRRELGRLDRAVERSASGIGAARRRFADRVQGLVTEFEKLASQQRRLEIDVTSIVRQLTPR